MDQLANALASGAAAILVAERQQVAQVGDILVDVRKDAVILEGPRKGALGLSDERVGGRENNDALSA